MAEEKKIETNKEIEKPAAKPRAKTGTAKKTATKKSSASKSKKLEADIKAKNDIAAADPKYHGKSKLERKTTEVLTVLAGAAIGAFGTVSIMIPSGLTTGGIVGVARMIQHYTNWNYSLTYYAFTLIIMAIVWATLGAKELRKIILLSLAYPGFMFILEAFDIALKTDDTFLAAVFCGVTFGISNGLTFKAGYSSGGTDSLAKVIKFKKMPHVGINDITFVINTIITIASAFVFGVNIALYAVIIMYVTMKLGEAVMFGLNDKLVQLDIITDEPKELAEYVMYSLGRGVTSVNKTGEYTGESRKHLQVLCSPRESFLIKRFLAKRDPHSFVTVLHVSSVWGIGRGFSDINSIDD